MRVFIVSDEYPPQRGGVGVSCQRLATSLAGQGHCVTVATPLTVDHGVVPASEWGGVVQSGTEQGVEILRLGPMSSVTGSSGSGKIAGNMKRFSDLLIEEIERRAPDVLHAYYAYKSGYLTAFASGLTGVPFVLSIRGNDISRDMYLPSRLAAFQFTVSKAKAVTFVSQRLHDFATRLFPGLPHPVYIPNSVLLPDPIPEQTAVADRTICYIGGIREKKGISQLLHAYGLLRASTKARLVLIGDLSKESDSESFRRLVSENPYCSDISMTGMLDRIEALAHLRAASVSVCPSLDDGMPNGLLESLALGIPTVASSIFGDFLVDGVSAVLCNPRNGVAMADGIQRVLLDQNLANRLTTGGSDLIHQRHRPIHETHAFCEVYDYVRKRP